MIVVGIGCRRGSSADDVDQAVRAVVVESGLTLEKVDALATAAFKKQEFGISAAAGKLALPLRYVSQGRLLAAQSACVSTSAEALEAVGVASVSEAAALSAAGQGAYLVAPKSSRHGVSCAIAQGGVR